MKLYFYPGACSLAPHIIAAEAGIALELDKVDLQKRETSTGFDYTKINPKGYVPALKLDNGEVLTEGPAIMLYLADLKPDSGLAPPPAALDRYRLQEMLSYINSEIHKTFSPLFNPTTTAGTRGEKIDYLQRRYEIIEQRLASHPFLVGDHFSAADAYLFTITSWANHLRVDLSQFPRLNAFQERVASRSAVQAALRAEGLLPG